MQIICIFKESQRFGAIKSQGKSLYGHHDCKMRINQCALLAKMQNLEA